MPASHMSMPDLLRPINKHPEHVPSGYPLRMLVRLTVRQTQCLTSLSLWSHGSALLKHGLEAQLTSHVSELLGLLFDAVGLGNQPRILG